MEVGNSASKRYNCSKCGFETDYIVHLKNHVCSPKKYEKCNVTPDSKEWQAQHIHQNTSPINSSYKMIKNTGKFSCTDCGYSCKSFGLLKLHKNIHYQGLFKCTLCSFVTNFENLYRMHKEKHSDIENASRQVNNKFCNEQKNQTINDTPDGLEDNMSLKDENKSPVKLPDERKIKRRFNKNREHHQCPLCSFRSHRVKPYGKHLNRTHGRELSVKIGKFLGEEYVKPRIRNSLTPEEIASLVAAMEASKEFVGKSENVFTQIASSGIPIVKSAISKIKNQSKDGKSKFKKLKTWTKDEKLEIYWCDVFARNALFPKADISKRRRRALMERGVLSTQKLRDTPDTLFHSITANIKICKSSVSREEALEVVKDVENYIKSKVNSTDKNLRESLEKDFLFDFELCSTNKKTIRKIRKGT
ncbi:UNVERIFIED_CONTAM: hypothetical protein RMT77_005778 [Armadillidium vulgare]